MKILVVIPFHTSYKPTWSGIAELKNCTEHEFNIQPAQCADGGAARNKVAKHFQGQYDGVLFVDADQTFTLENVLQLINHDKPVIFGAYRRHEDRTKFNSGTFTGEPGVIDRYYPDDTRGLKAVDFGGIGFLYCSKEALEAIEYPWFRHTMVDGDETNFGIGFCLNASKHFTLWTDFDCEVGHIQRTAANIEWHNQKGVSNMEIPDNFDKEGLALIQKVSNIVNIYRAMAQQCMGQQKRIEELERLLSEKNKADKNKADKNKADKNKADS